MPNTLTDGDWELLLSRIELGECTPFLGAGACFGVLPLGHEIAQEWAERWGYPLDDDARDLVRVAQFLAVRFDAMFPKDQMLIRLRNVTPPDFTGLDEPHHVLATLNLPVYITTNYDDFMIQALKSRGKLPSREVCRWNKRVKDRLKNQPSILGSQSEAAISPNNPVVFHLHGHTELRESLVLTEDDYLDFLVAISKDPELIPPRIQEAFAGTSLLFLGYRFADWNFRVLFRSIISYLEISLAQAHVSVQLLPVGEKVTQEEKELVQAYFDRYFQKQEIRVYWGTCREFAADLKSRWEALNRGR
jgi:SIR2-like domain